MLNLIEVRAKLRVALVLHVESLLRYRAKKEPQYSMDNIILKLKPSRGRRIVGAVLLMLCGFFILFYTVFAAQDALFFRVAALLIGALFLWQAQWNLRVSNTTITLTKEGLYAANGDLICRVSNMVEIDDGWFSFKPSNGFLVRLYEAEDPKWARGLYWRIGKRLGVGGAIEPAEVKALSAQLSLLIRERSMGTEFS